MESEKPKLKKIRRITELVLYLILFTIALVNVLDTFKQYMERNTSYLVSKEPISLNDLPTLTFLYEYSDFALHTGKNKCPPMGGLKVRAAEIFLGLLPQSPDFFYLKRDSIPTFGSPRHICHV